MIASSITFDLFHERCIYSSLAHAVYTFREPFFQFEQSWDNENYSFYFGSTRGTISFRFDLRIAAGAARDDMSKRRYWYPKKKAAELFSRAPKKIVELAQNETLEYLYDTIDGTCCPMATVAMWHDGEKLFLSEDEPTLAQNGGRYFLLLGDSSIDLSEYWRKQYSLSDSEIRLIEQLKGFVHSSSPYYASKPFAKILTTAKGTKEGLESLLELGIRAYL